MICSQNVIAVQATTDPIPILHFWWYSQIKRKYPMAVKTSVVSTSRSQDLESGVCRLVNYGGHVSTETTWLWPLSPISSSESLHIAVHCISQIRWLNVEKGIHPGGITQTRFEPEVEGVFIFFWKNKFEFKSVAADRRYTILMRTFTTFIPLHFSQIAKLSGVIALWPLTGWLQKVYLFLKIYSFVLLNH